MKQPDVHERRYVLYFNESVRGLSVGAPVTLWGLTVGRVTSVDLTFDPATLKIRPRVIVTFSPTRFMGHVSQQEQAAAKALLEMSEEKRTQALRRMVEEQGLRARLQTGNLLSGELYVALEYHPNAPKVHLDWSADPLELPVASGGLASIEDKLDSILTKVDQMPLDAMGTQVKDALVKLNTTLKDANVLIERINTQLVPAATETLQQLHVAIANGDQALFGKESAGPQDLRDTLVEMAEAARAVRVLVDYLQRHPEALIRGKKKRRSPDAPHPVYRALVCCDSCSVLQSLVEPLHPEAHGRRGRRPGGLQLLRGRRTGLDTPNRGCAADRAKHRAESGLAG